MKLGNSAALTRVYNRSVVLDALRRSDSLSRVELSRLSGLTPQAIRNIVEDLLTEGFVKQIGRRKGLRGQPQIEIAINPDGGYSLGFYVVGTRCYYLGTNFVGEIVFPGGSFMIDGSSGPIEHSLEAVVMQCNRAMEKKIRLGVGIAVSSPLTTAWLRHPRFENFEQVSKIQDFFGADVWIENDANAAAMAENLLGAARECSDFLYVFIGDGVGGAIVRDRKLHGGFRGNAGEFGHIIVDPDGPHCHCGNKGCLQTFLSLTELGDQVDVLSAENGKVQAWLSKALPALTRAIVSLENAFDPDRIILGGTAPGWLLELLLSGLRDMPPSVRSGADTPRVEISRLGSSSALLGASALPLLNLMTPHPDKLTKQSLQGAR